MSTKKIKKLITLNVGLINFITITLVLKHSENNLNHITKTRKNPQKTMKLLTEIKKKQYK